jgi:glycosyltransferase involved in cell wall biosynthesis
VSVGTYGVEKGQDILVRAYECLPKSYRERIALTFVGNDKEKDDIVYNMVETLSHKEPLVYMKPLMPKAKIMELYQKSDGIIASSRREVLSMAVLENMMLGKCAMVSTGTGNAAYIEDGKSGYIFETENAKALSDCMIRMADNAERLQAIGVCARKVYEDNFSMPIFEGQVKEKIMDLIGK